MVRSAWESAVEIPHLQGLEPASMQLEVNSTALQQELEKLATYSDVPSPAVTRVVYSATDLAARRYVKQLCRDAGLSIREDAAGNTFARWTGSDAALAAIGTGSH